jgi:diaminopimelate epimerase
MINFTKMQGLGNDFVVIDAINQAVEFTPAFICGLSDRHFGIGFDQLLLVEKPQSAQADFKYRIFNADGSEVSQCGNGARCFARFVRDKKLTDKSVITVETRSGVLVLAFAENESITVNMGIPKHAPEHIPLLAEQESKFYTVKLNEVEKAFGAVSMGNPHAVLQVNDVTTAAVTDLGYALERHSMFPERANIGFMQIIDRQHIKLRVYERGAAETLACGSGACAAVVIGIEQNALDAEVVVELPGGLLNISWAGRGEPVFMNGPAVSVFEGKIPFANELVSLGLSEREVTLFLQQHPEFFNNHLDLLEKINIPHPSGAAVSLIAKQLEVFRSRHHEMESQLTSLIEIARENDTSMLRMHKLTLALLDASTLREVIENLNIVLTDYFHTDFMSLRIVKTNREWSTSSLFLEPDSHELHAFNKELLLNEVFCGCPSLAQARLLFGSNAMQVQSCAIIPMIFTELEGVLAIGSTEAERFHFSMGNLFLTQLSELIGTRLISLLSQYVDEY